MTPSGYAKQSSWIRLAANAATVATPNQSITLSDP